MRWFRSNIRFGSRLTLIALAVQMLLSFGHVHLPALGPQAGAPSVTASAPVHKSQGLADTDCPICALIQLAGTSAPSAAPVLPLPLNRGPVGLQIIAELPWAASPQLQFRARAPPSV